MTVIKYICEQGNFVLFINDKMDSEEIFGLTQLKAWTWIIDKYLKQICII